jgi:hypothetical protein
MVYVSPGDVGVAPNAGVETEKPAVPYTPCVVAGCRPPVPCRRGGRTGEGSSGRSCGRYPFAIGMRDSVANESVRWSEGSMMICGFRSGTGRRGMLNV